MGLVVPTGASAAGVGTGISAASFFGSTGVSSTVECFPVVHGGMARNSSKVRTRGLQHFQPISSVSTAYGHSIASIKASQPWQRIEPTFLSLMEYWRARMVNTLLISVRKHLATPLVNTLPSHIVRDSGRAHNPVLPRVRRGCK